MNWKITQTIPTLAIPTLAHGIEFYGRLGFELDWKWPEESPSHAGLMRGGCSIMLAQCDPCVQADVYFIVDDVEACYAALIAARPWELAQAMGEAAGRDNCPPGNSLHAPAAPSATEYGLRDFSMVDPWGHQMSFGQAIEE